MTQKFTRFACHAAVLACVAAAACGGSKDDMKASADSMQADSMAPMNGMGASTGAAAANNLSDANILSLVALANGGEVADGKMAEQHATNKDVKGFAKQMVDDHGSMQKDVDKLAKKDNLTPQSPSMADSLSKQAKQMSDSLSKLKGAAFDKAYMAHEVDEHQKTVQNLQQWQSAAQNADLKNALGDAIKKVQGHLQKAQDIQSKLGA